MQELGHDQVGHVVLHDRAKEDDPVLQESRVQVEGSFSAVRRFDDGRDEGRVGVAHGGILLLLYDAT